MLEILKTGVLATVQDRGRFGFAHLGVPRSGALDWPALARANTLVGNPPEAAGLELAQGRLTFRAHADVLLAVTGAIELPPTLIRAGQLFEIGSPRTGMFCYLAVLGGVAVDPVLGSRSTDTLSGLGPPILKPGTHLPLGPPPGPAHPTYSSPPPGPAHPASPPPSPYDPALPTADPSIGSASKAHASGTGFSGTGSAAGSVTSSSATSSGAEIPGAEIPGAGIPGAGIPGAGIPGAGADWGAVRVRVRFGPRADWFTDPAQLTRSGYQMKVMNRTGARLAGERLTRSVAGELPSEGLVAGAIQVPGDGQPIVFLADHPTTGGYPVIATVHEDDLPLIVQARPGTMVVFCGP
jgi:allophanate hydrolase subunit 2